MNRAQMYHDMTSAELKDKYASLKSELFNLRFQHSTGQLKNPLQLQTVKRDIARVMTVLSERDLGIVKNEGKKKPAAKKAKKTEEGAV